MLSTKQLKELGVKNTEPINEKHAWNKRCKKCDSHIPDEFELCGSCILRKYGLDYKNSIEPEGHSSTYYRDDAVVFAIRKALME